MREIDVAVEAARKVRDAPAVTLTDHADITFVLRSKVFAPISPESGHGGQWHTMVIRDTPADLHGDDHFERRRILTSLLKRTAVIREYEHTYLRPEMHKLLASAPDTADGRPRLELVSELRRVQIKLIARLIGVDRLVDSDRSDDAFEKLLSEVERGVRSKFVDDPEAVIRLALQAQRMMAEEYFAPALERRTEIYARVKAGNAVIEDMPQDLFSLIVRHREHYDKFGDDAVYREASNMFSAAVGSSVNAACFAVSYLDAWLKEHPEDAAKRTDTAFLARCFAEALRLGQTNSLFRTAMEDAALPSGIQIRAGEVAIIDRPAGNAALEQGGTSAVPGVHEFDPNRSLAKNTAQYGLAFGGGAHMCVGRELTVANFPRSEAQSEDDTVGLGVRMFQMLEQLDVKPEPDGLELAPDMSGRPTWKRLVVTCRRPG
ncbi:hypothetical protein ACFHW2_40600 [Actinomadura sp. LOL_016]|uniref:hypothetical protein n=1 Tax=unclassified Actinomadura TaxID=2626254 RepID=UPI003A80B5A1